MIVIIGATGKVGSKTAAQLLSLGKKVKAIGRSAVKLKLLQTKGAAIEIGDILDAEFLSTAFKGADAIMLMIPQNMQSNNVQSFQQKAGEAQIKALMNTDVKNIVFISSLGSSDTEDGSLIAGLRKQEQRLNNLPADVNVISLRPTGFMENLFSQIPIIKHRNIMGSPIRPELEIGVIATDDIAMVAADKLAKLDFKGKSFINLLGKRDYSQQEMAAIIGKAIGKPGLQYVQVSYEQNKSALIQHGISESVADAMVAMWKNINAGWSAVERTPDSTNPTTLESFAENIFKYAYAQS